MDWWAGKIKSEARKCGICGKPLWRIDPRRRKNSDGKSLGYEPVCRTEMVGGKHGKEMRVCWNGKACAARVTKGGD